MGWKAEWGEVVERRIYKRDYINGLIKRESRKVKGEKERERETYPMYESSRCHSKICSRSCFHWTKVVMGIGCRYARI